MTNPKKLFLRLLLGASLALGGNLCLSSPSTAKELKVSWAPGDLPYVPVTKYYTQAGRTVIIPITTPTDEFTLSFPDSLTITATLLKQSIDGTYTSLLYVTPSQAGMFGFYYEDSDSRLTHFHLEVTGVYEPSNFKLSPVVVFWSNSLGAYYTANPDEQHNIRSHPEWGYVEWGIGFWAYTLN